jgi:HAD superfamily hydrolase (TIGR01490 family)
MSSRKNSIAAFIDFDSTLCDIYLWQALFAHHQKLRYKRATMYKFIAYHLPLWLLYEAHLISQEFFYRNHATNLAWLVKGVSIERAEAIWEWLIENEIVPHLRHEMLATIEDHKSQEHRIILISGSFKPLLDLLAIRLGVERVIATPLEVNNGHYTGRIIPPLNIGQGKVERLKRFLERPEEDIELTKSYFYTDSNVDTPVMEMFGHPVAVYPDTELASLAAARGWMVIGETQSRNLQTSVLALRCEAAGKDICRRKTVE